MLYEDVGSKEKISSGAKLDIVTAGLTGMLAGAAGITLLALSDKEIRKMVLARASTAKDFLREWSAKKLQQPKEPIEETTEEIQRDMHN